MERKIYLSLPPLFAKKVKSLRKDQNNGSLNYHRYTYGELIQMINTTRLSICTGMKLKKKAIIKRKVM